jgi:hypothetical protein
MSVALNLHKRRVYIRGNIQNAYSWLCDFFDANHDMLRFSFPFLLKPGEDGDFEILPHSDWTVEYDPDPLVKPWVRSV